MKVLLIDDEPLALDFLEIQLKKVSDGLKIQKFTELDLKKNKDLLLDTDLLFLDIEMPQVNGLELASQISEINPRLPIVFVTAFNEYAIQAFEMNALDYIMKPVQTERLDKTLKRIPFLAEVPENEKALRVSVCGEFRLEDNKGQMRPIHWRTTKAQELFLYLLHKRGKPVQKTELIEMFWEEVEEEKAFAQLYTSIYYIRKNMFAYRGHFTIKSKQNGYLLVTENVEIDMKEWEKFSHNAAPVDEDTIGLHEEMMSLYTGGYLESYLYAWAESERFRLEQLWVERAKQIAMYYDQQNLHEKAVVWFDRVVDIRPEDEHAHFKLMEIYDELGYGLLVNHQYQHLIKASKELDIPLNTKVREWYESWKRERADNTTF